MARAAGRQPALAVAARRVVLAGALPVYPLYAQGGDEPLTARFLAGAGPSNQGGAGPTLSIRIRSSEDISAGY